MNTEELYPCPCCGYKTLNSKPLGTYLICPICFWEDDDETINSYGYSWVGSHQVSLRQAQRNYIAFGACEQEWLDYVRSPTDSDVQDSNWQTIDALEEHTRLALIAQITAAFDGVERYTYKAHLRGLHKIKGFIAHAGGESSTLRRVSHAQVTGVPEGALYPKPYPFRVGARYEPPPRTISVEGGEEYQNAIATKTSVEKYFESKDRQYQQFH